MIEKRRSNRVDCFSQGQIIVENDDDRLACSVWNMSETGALIEISSEDMVPDAFTLLTEADQKLRRCVIVRRTGNRFGVIFQ